MSELTDSIAGLREALAERGIDLDRAIVPGLPGAQIRNFLTEAELPINEALVEWFEFCGGLIGSSGEGTVLQGRGYLSVTEALAQRNDAPSDDYPLDYARLVPLTRDHPVVVVDVDTGHVRELDAEQGWVELAESPADWIRSQTEALLPLGPHPHARSVLPLSTEPGVLGLDRSSEHRLTFVVKYLLSIEIAQMWLEIAPLGSKQDNLGLEREQASALAGHLFEQGVAAAAEITVFETPQRAEPPHNMAIWYLKADVGDSGRVIRPAE